MDEWQFGWQFRAACRGEDAAMFFAPNYFEKRHEKDAREERARRQYCNKCEVREQCLEYALRIREPHGMWGGLNEAQRRAVLRDRDREAGARRAG